MKIHEKNVGINISSYGSRVGNPPKTDTKTDGKNGTTFSEEKVAISPRAAELKEASAAIKSVPDIREEKIARIREKVQDGRYTVDTKKIAEKIIADILETRSIN